MHPISVWLACLSLLLFSTPGYVFGQQPPYANPARYRLGDVVPVSRPTTFSRYQESTSDGPGSERPDEPQGFEGRGRERNESLEAAGGEDGEAEDEEEEEEIETDRDSFTPATTVVKRGRTIVEAAYTFLDNRSVAETHSYPEILIRYGLTERMELRLGWNYEIGGVGSPITGNVPELHGPTELEEEAKILYGAKFFLSEQANWTPQSSLVIQGYTPTSGESNLTAFSATHVFGWELENGWHWDSALRYGLSSFEEDRFSTWAPSTVLKIPMNERVKAHVEYFGILSDGREIETTQHYFSPGAHYLINRNLEFGVRVGWGLNDESANFLVNSGFGWQF